MGAQPARQLGCRLDQLTNFLLRVDVWTEAGRNPWTTHRVRNEDRWVGPGPQRCRLAPEQIHAPEAVFHVAQESQPGRTIGVLSRPAVMGKNPANNVFVDLDVERQGDLLRNPRTAPVGITLLHFDDRMDEFRTRSLRAGLPTA